MNPRPAPRSPCARSRLPRPPTCVCQQRLGELQQGVAAVVAAVQGEGRALAAEQALHVALEGAGRRAGLQPAEQHLARVGRPHLQLRAPQLVPAPRQDPLRVCGETRGNGAMRRAPGRPPPRPGARTSPH